MMRYSSMSHMYQDDVRGRVNEARNEESEEESSDSNESTVVLRKTIMIGSDYQATVPKGLSPYTTASPYAEDKLLWEPQKLPEPQVINYLNKMQAIAAESRQGVYSIPTGSHTRDDEEMLYALLKCDYKESDAIKNHSSNKIEPIDTMNLWTEEECRNFESGLRIYNKNFFLIQQEKVKTRSVSELVQFYYLWKKTERHDAFANEARLEKKKYNLHPGVTDYMDRLLDETENVMTPESYSPLTYSLIYGDVKFQQQKLTASSTGESSGTQQQPGFSSQSTENMQDMDTAEAQKSS